MGLQRGPDLKTLGAPPAPSPGCRPGSPRVYVVISSLPWPIPGPSRRPKGARVSSLDATACPSSPLRGPGCGLIIRSTALPVPRQAKSIALAPNASFYLPTPLSRPASTVSPASGVFTCELHGRSAIAGRLPEQPSPFPAGLRTRSGLSNKCRLCR
jgi:hypothetical protein